MKATGSETVKSRLRRLLALVERGEEGESKNAERHLNRLLELHDLKMEDIASDRPGVFEFKCKNDEEYRILMQIVCQAKNSYTVSTGRSKRKVLVVLTRGEYAEVISAWTVYQEEWRREVERMVLAFVNVNGIFPASNNDNPSSRRKRVITPEDLEEERRILDRIGVMEAQQVKRRLMGGGSHG